MQKEVIMIQPEISRGDIFSESNEGGKAAN